MFIGELERIFLVLREKIALRRLQARDGSNPVPSFSSAVGELPDAAPEGGPAQDANGGPSRGQKRQANDGPSSPSKRPAL